MKGKTSQLFNLPSFVSERDCPYNLRLLLRMLGLDKVQQVLRVAVRKYRAFGGRIREINFAYFLATERPLVEKNFDPFSFL